VQRSQPDSHPIWRTLYAVTTTAYRSDVPVFLIDPVILSEIQRELPFKTKKQFLRPDDDDQNSYCRVCFLKIQF
jgi:hypothetical protein